MRIGFGVLFAVMIAVLAVCSRRARLSEKPIGKAVAFLLASLILPMTGNLILIVFSTEWICHVGMYTYYLGMDVLMFAMMRFTLKYCGMDWSGKFRWFLVCGLLLIDVVQLLLNPVFGHAFSSEVVMVEGAPYYKLVPRLGQTFHRVVDYGLVMVFLAIFLMKMIRSPRIYVERYAVIFISIIVAAAWQSLYIFSRTPVDRSMIAYAFFGLMVYYFSLHYRPMRLMDRLLAGIASDMKESLFFFDSSGHCIWANPQGLSLVGVDEEHVDSAPERLTEIFGDTSQLRDNRGRRQDVYFGEELHFYTIEKKTLRDKRDKKLGSFLSFRDDTEAELAMRRKMYNATHDALTGLFTREFLYEQVRERLDQYPETAFVIAYLDISEFKLINDVFGKDFGDLTLKQVADLVRRVMPKEGVYGRLGGDTFGLFVPMSAFPWKALEAEISGLIVRDENRQHHMLLHLGIYEVSDRQLEVSAMFDRAHMALDTIRDEYHVFVAYYTDELRDKTLWNQHISGDLEVALRERQILPYLQPLVNVHGTVVGAEALVRWIHPVDGFLSPAMFIPIFEKNGMIADVDRYMWRCACEILAEWQKQGRDTFISINVSPKDFYFMDVPEELRSLVR